MNKNKKEKNVLNKILTLLPIFGLCAGLVAITFFSKKIEEKKVQEAKSTIIEKSKKLDTEIKDLKDILHIKYIFIKLKYTEILKLK